MRISDWSSDVCSSDLFTINDNPALGDVFTVVPNTGGVGDNANALRLGEIINKGVLDGGSTSIGSGFGQLVAQVGASTAQARIGLDAQTALRNQATQAQERQSGVEGKSVSVRVGRGGGRKLK